MGSGRRVLWPPDHVLRQTELGLQNRQLCRGGLPIFRHDKLIEFLAVYDGSLVGAGGFGKQELHDFVLGAVAPHTPLITDDWPSYQTIPVSGTTQSRLARRPHTSHYPGSTGCFQISSVGPLRLPRTAKD